ncbi:hypothetical protein ACFS7Z_13150 [Pontibacter toksunensis]|uniref:Uncharacterized protein n=1 Tax=Pontibacter toksunensis TaxID=1332631 RepID=A0ABW6BVK6_9BACT
MKTFLLYLLPLLLSATTASSQEKFKNITASLEAVGETATAGRFISAANTQKSNAIFNSIRPVSVRYKDALWFLLVVDIPGEKQVVHMTQEQLGIIKKIVAAKDGKTHYLEVTNFFEVFDANDKTEIDQRFLNNVKAAISKKHWYRNNAVFMVSSTLVAEQHVIRFQLPFASNVRICRHVKAMYNLKEEFYEATPADFISLFISGGSPGTIRVSTH